MNRRTLVLLLVVALPLGLLGVVARRDEPARQSPTFAALQPPTLPFVPKMGFLSASWFCAGVPVADGGQGGDVVVVNPLETPLAATYTLFSDTKGTEPVVGTFEVPPRDTYSLAMEELQTGTAFVSAMVEISGSGGYVEQRADSDDGSAVSPCSNSTSANWYFADNYTLNDSSEALVITNPFPDDAIIDIGSVTPQGSFDSPHLEGLAVRGRSIRVITEAELAKEESVLAMSVVVRRGRVVVARSQRYQGERVGFTNTLGAPSTSPEWYFADGESGDDVYFERYTIFNPNDAEVAVSAVVLGVTSDDPTFVNVRDDVVPPGGVVSFTMADWEKLPAGRHHLEFSTESDLGVVVERAITRRAGDGPVTTVCLGAPMAFGPYIRWSMGIGTDIAVDGVLVVANRAYTDATVTVKALGPGGEVVVPGLEATALPAGAVITIAIPDQAAALGVPLVVEADQPIVVERQLPRDPDLRGRSASLAMARLRDAGMIDALIAAAVVAGAVALGVVLRRRRPVAAPTQPAHAVPAQLDRRDFATDAPWLVAVFSSATCHTCADVVRKAQVLASAEVAVVDVEFDANRDLHRKYDIQAVPIVAVADAEGVVHRGFAGPVTATDLWAAVADARQPGSTPEPELGAS